MESDEIFRIFDNLSEILIPFCIKRLEAIKKTSQNICAPWNLWYGISGDFTREEDQYFPLETTLDTWGRSFAGLGINYQGTTLHLDLLERS